MQSSRGPIVVIDRDLPFAIDTVWSEHKATMREVEKRSRKPFETNNLFLQTRGLPKLATGDQARYILQRLADASRPFGTTVAVKGDTAEIELKRGN